LISVVMANFNGGVYLEEAIGSVVEQNFDDYECIIVDDGSTDDSRKIIESYQSRYPGLIRAIFLAKNQGQGEAFNVGIGKSVGDIVSFIDSDDLWYSGKLATVDDVFRKNADIALHQHNLELIRNGVFTKKKVRKFLVTGDYLSYTKQTGDLPIFVPTTGVSIPRSILEKILPIPGEFRTCADGYLTRTAFCFGEVASDPKCWGAYRVHDGNNVFENEQFDTKGYISEILNPALNRYYARKGIEIRFGAGKTNAVGLKKIKKANRFARVMQKLIRQ